MDPTSIRLPEQQLTELDDFVEESNYFETRTHAIRYAVREMIQKGNGHD